MPAYARFFIVSLLTHEESRHEMNREIKIIKRGVRNLRQVERENALAYAHNKADASPVQLARTIQEWIRIHRERASEELAAARALRTVCLPE